LDYAVFIDIDPATQLDRRLKRDVQHRGYTEEEVLYQWEKHVLPSYDKFVHPFEHLADFRFRNNEHAATDFETLVQNISKQLSKE
jgi:uridine kinase